MHASISSGSPSIRRVARGDDRRWRSTTCSSRATSSSRAAVADRSRSRFPLSSRSSCAGKWRLLPQREIALSASCAAMNASRQCALTASRETWPLPSRAGTTVRLRFQRGGVGAGSRRAVHPRSVVVGALRRSDVLLAAARGG